MGTPNNGKDFLLGRFDSLGGKLRYRYRNETLIIEAWGSNSLRVRSTRKNAMPENDWALLSQKQPTADVVIKEYSASITNGRIRAEINRIGTIRFLNQHGKVLLEEYVRQLDDMADPTYSALLIEPRNFKPVRGGDYSLTARFAANPSEKIFGMGQYQHGLLNLKGAELELAHRNSQASIPFLVSSLGYGFLWNNPAIGRVSFATNKTTWTAESTDVLDYWVTAGNTPAEIEEAYASVTGTVPMIPDYAIGFWQCKLRYQTQEELLSVAREYKRRGLPLSVIVIDFFHWPMQGEWKFDPVYWPDPDAMVAELSEMGVELMVSIWPTVDQRSENYEEMRARGLLMQTEAGPQISYEFLGNTIYYDPTNPEARSFVWDKVKSHYYDKGIHAFWLDEAEPQYDSYDYDHYRYHIGPNIRYGNLYPVMYAKTFYDGVKAEGQERILNLIRCAWAGSQRYGALLWSGDIMSSFESMRIQLKGGLNAGMAGIPWWTSDIGGFFGGNIHDEKFHELLVRWFQFGTFSPVMRLHGNREPSKPPVGNTGGASFSGADNEIWSFGEEVYDICVKFLRLRERLRPYITSLMREAHIKGTPVMRPLFYDFPGDPISWDVSEQYMFGPDLIVAPVMREGQRETEVYLPEGATWTNAWSGDSHDGGARYSVTAPIEEIPVFARDGSSLAELFADF